MGAVYEAEDATLGRTVALKVLHRELSEHDRQRIQREALALARLSHPNVVHVYEIGREEERTFIAMELVRGQTLDRWQREHLPWRECLRVYLQAGQGLAAAHAVGLIHRDFKPSNCILGEDGRVRVVDFGLARAAERVEDGEAETEHDGGSASEAQPLEARLTQTGAVVGTVAYMPLEQLMGTPASTASDQFSFCVSLYEALHGSRPFAGQELGKLTRSLRLGRVEPAPKGSRVPARLRRVLLRGLSREPTERWPSMDALLGELSRVASPRGRATFLMGLGGVLGLVAGAAFLAQEEDEPCGQPQAALDGTWGSEDRAAMIAAFEALDESSDASFLPRVQARLDAYSKEWVEMYEQSCRATFVLHQQSERMFDQRMRCLERRRNRLHSTIDALVTAETPQMLVDRTILPFKLPALEPCADLETLATEQQLPDDEAQRQAVEQLRRRIDEADTLYDAGEFSRGVEVATETLRQARELGYLPVLAEALASLGRLQTSGGAPSDAQATLEEAVLAAARTDEDRTAAAAWTWLLYSLGLQGRLEEAGSLELAARAAVEHAGDDVVRGWLLNNLGVLQGMRGDLERASEQLRRALEVKQQALGPAHVDVGISWFNLGLALADRGANGDALEAFQQARSIFEATVGDRHPLVHFSIFGLCRVELASGRPEAAVKLCRDVLVRFETSTPPPGWQSRVGYYLAQALWDAGSQQEALDTARRALALALATDPTVARDIDGWLATKSVVGKDEPPHDEPPL